MVNNPFRIINGTVTKPNEFPWQALMQFRYINQTNGNEYIKNCGATLITDQWALTAGHCIDTNQHNPEKFILLFGLHNRSHQDNNVVMSQVSLIKVHPKFKDFKHYDIALCKLRVPIDLNTHKNVAPVCLQSPDKSLSFTQCYASGYGQTESKKWSDVLLKAHVKLWTNQMCHSRRPEILDSHLCSAVPPENHSGVCFGDSGGPLQCKDNDRWYQIGINSYVSSRKINNINVCGNTGMPDVFTRVSSYYHWIENTIATF